MNVLLARMKVEILFLRLERVRKKRLQRTAGPEFVRSENLVAPKNNCLINWYTIETN